VYTEVAKIADTAWGHRSMEGCIVMTDTRSSGFGDLLRRYRQAIGLNQEELAERATLSTRAISELERGTRQYPYCTTLYLLAKALLLSPQQLAEFEQAGRRPAAKGMSVQQAVAYALEEEGRG
jgi:transcriptional regulator with XRE-family HTH domain